MRPPVKAHLGVTSRFHFEVGMFPVLVILILN